MKKGRLMVCPGDVTVTIHPPISTAGVAREQTCAPSPSGSGR